MHAKGRPGMTMMRAYRLTHQAHAPWCTWRGQPPPIKRFVPGLRQPLKFSNTSSPSSGIAQMRAEQHMMTSLNLRPELPHQSLLPPRAEDSLVTKQLGAEQMTGACMPPSALLHGPGAHSKALQ